MKLLMRISLLLTILFLFVTPTFAQEPVVHALLFYSHICPHCRKVINEDFPPLIEKYGDQLIILAINTSSEQGNELYHAAIEYYQIPQERLGVPTLIISGTVLVGSLEIPQKFPDLIENGLATGGVGWPDFPELQKILEMEGYVDADLPVQSETKGDIDQNQSVDPESEIANETMVVQTQSDRDDSVLEKTEVAVISDADKVEKDTTEKEEAPQDKLLGIDRALEEATPTGGVVSLLDRFAQDKIGNTASVIVLMGMVLSVAIVGTNVARISGDFKPWPNWVVPVLVLVGLCVAVYMSYVEVTETEAVCGPVGDCNTVQQSSYALLYGRIPIGILGIVGYLLIGLTWLSAIWGPEQWGKISVLSCWLFCVFGALFSIYLTFLEPFVIGATCAWCLTSAILMHLLLWATTAPAIKVWRGYRSPEI